MYRCESWTIKKAEWVGEWSRSVVSNSLRPHFLKEISPEYSLERLMLNLKYSNTLATWCEELTHLKRPWCWERLKARGEGDDRGWHGWIASPTRWTWVWASSGNWWWTGKPGMLQSIGLQRVGHNWVTELTEGERKENDSWCHDVDIIPGFGFFITSIWASLIAQLDHLYSFVKPIPWILNFWYYSNTFQL